MLPDGDTVLSVYLFLGNTLHPLMRLYLNSFHESRNFPRKGAQFLLSYSEPQICDSTEYKAKLSNRTLRTKYLSRK